MASAISFFLLLAGDLALDGERAEVTDLLERAQEELHVDVAQAQSYFHAGPAAAHVRLPLRVLAVDALDVAAHGRSAGIGSSVP